jgi:hypothetical protein
VISLLLSWNHSGFNVFCGKRIYPDDETANLTLEFAEGQDANEPHPRYFVTGGTVTYEA